MKLYAILTWYDESPTWLAATITSLTKIGADHLIAVDGAYIHYDGEGRSNAVQAEAIHLACDAANIGLTMVRPQEKMWTEVEKRSFGFKLFEAHAEKFVDWCLVIDADEVISEENPFLKKELCETDSVVASARIWESIDPDTDEGKNNSAKTMEIYHRIPNPTVFGHEQTRFWKCIDNMRVELNHYNYLGDIDGVTHRLRGDHVGDKSIGNVADIHTLESPVLIEHRDWWRIAHRRQAKLDYYELRDACGLERAT